MRNLISVFSFVFVFFSCAEEKNKNIDINSQLDSNGIKHQVFDSVGIEGKRNIQSTENKTRIEPFHFDSTTCLYDSLPFGCGRLLTYRFPKKFYSGVGAGCENNLPGKILDTICQCYNHINENIAKTIPYPYSKEKFEKYRIVPTKKFLMYDSSVRALNYLSYKLPDFGPYHCYYSSNQTYIFDSMAMTTHHGEEGYLLLYSPQRKLTKILTIYAERSDEISGSLLLFYIDTNKTIHLYLENAFEEGDYCNKLCEINITESGEIKIN